MPTVEGSEQWCNQLTRAFSTVVPAGLSLLLPSDGRRIFASIFTPSLPAIQVWITKPDFSGGFIDNPAYFVDTVGSTDLVNLHSRDWCDMVANDIWISSPGVAIMFVAEILNEWPIQCGGLEGCPQTTSRWINLEVGALDISRKFVFSQDIRRVAFSWSPNALTLFRIASTPESGLANVWQFASTHVFPPLLYSDYGPLIQSEIWAGKQGGGTQATFRESTIVP